MPNLYNEIQTVKTNNEFCYTDILNMFSQVHSGIRSNVWVCVGFGFLCGFWISLLNIFLKIHINIVLLPTHTPEGVCFYLGIFMKLHG
jgi:hypothetical protein